MRGTSPSLRLSRPGNFTGRCRSPRRRRRTWARRNSTPSGYIKPETWEGGVPFPKPSGPFKAQEIMYNLEKRTFSWELQLLSPQSLRRHQQQPERGLRWRIRRETVRALRDARSWSRTGGSTSGRRCATSSRPSGRLSMLRGMSSARTSRPSSSTTEHLGSAHVVHPVHATSPEDVVHGLPRIPSWGRTRSTTTTKDGCRRSLRDPVPVQV